MGLGLWLGLGSGLGLGLGLVANPNPNFLARMGGPSMDLVALGLRPIDELSEPERSAFVAAEARSPPPLPPPLPDGWQQAVVFATGRRYYVHAA